MKVLIVVGTSSLYSYTCGAMNEIEERLKLMNVQTEIWNLFEKSLPIMETRYYNSKHPNKNARYFINSVRQADAIVLGTPNYHSSFSGILKNALDLLPSDSFNMKPVGLFTHSGGIRSTEPLDQLRIVTRGLLGVAIPTQVATCNEDYKLIGDNYKIVNKDIEDRIQVFCEQLVDFSEKFNKHNEDTKVHS